MNSINQGFHVSAAVGEFLRVECPITVVILPAIVECDPGEAHLLDRRKRVIDLLELYRPTIPPSAPDRAKSAVWRRRHLKSLPHHEAAVFGKGVKVVPLMHGDKGVESMEALDWFQRAFTGGADSDAGMACVGHGNGKRYEAGSWFHVAYREANVFAPYIDDRSSS